MSWVRIAMLLALGWAFGALTERLFTRKAYALLWLALSLGLVAVSVFAGAWFVVVFGLLYSAFWTWMLRRELEGVT